MRIVSFLWVPQLNGSAMLNQSLSYFKITTNILQWFTNNSKMGFQILGFYVSVQQWRHPTDLVNIGLILKVKLMPIQLHDIIGKNTMKFLIRTWVKSSLWSVLCTWSCMLVWVSSSAFFSNDITHTFLFCLHLVAAALFRSRNFRRRSSGSSSTTLLRRPPLGGGDCIVCVGCICWVAGDIWNTWERYQHHWAHWWVSATIQPDM